MLMTAAFAVVSLIIIKFVNRALKRHHALSYAAVIGFVVGSVLLVAPSIFAKITWACPLFFLAGLALSFLEFYYKEKMTVRNAAKAAEVTQPEAERP